MKRAAANVANGVGFVARLKTLDSVRGGLGALVGCRSVWLQRLLPAGQWHASLSNHRPKLQWR
jgi:hypothetical protein